MFCPFFSTIAFLLLFFAISLAGTITEEITFSRKDLIFEQERGYDLVYLPGATMLMDFGKPALPRISIKLLIPPGATATDIEIVSVEKEKISGEYNIYPAQPPQKISHKSPAISFIQPVNEVYHSNNTYPGELFSSIHNGTKCGYRIASFQFYPLQYIPAQKKLLLNTKIVINLHFEEETSPIISITEHQREFWSSAVSNLIDNSDLINDFSPPIKSSAPNIGTFGPTDYEYVIIAPDNTAWIDSLEVLAYWKTKKGLPAKVFNLQDDIYDVYSGSNQWKIKQFIDDAVTNWGTIWVFLAADDGSNATNSIPCMGVWANNGMSFPDNETITDMPCDRYYEDLNNDWNNDGDGTIGEHSDGPGGGELDWYADVYIGRMFADNATDAGKHVRRILWFEKNPDQDFCTSAIFSSTQLFPSARGYSRTDYWSSYMPGAWSFPGNATHPGYHYEQGINNYPGPANFLSNNLSDGYQFYGECGHGNWNLVMGDYYDWGPEIYNADVDDYLAPGYRCGIITANSCVAGAFDNFGGADCVAEHFYDKGIIGGALNGRNGLGYDSETESYLQELSDGICWQFFVQTFNQSFYHLGEAIAEDKDYFKSDLTDNSWNWCLKEYNAFGDPELPMWTAAAGPDQMLVTHAATVPMGASVFSVNVKDDDGFTNLPNALVTCWCKYDDNMYVTQLTDGSGNANLNVSPSLPVDTMWVTVTKQNYIPYEGFAVILGGTPDAPTLIQPFDNARIGDGNPASRTPTLSWNVPQDNDPGGENLHFKVQWDDDEDFTTPINTIESMTSTIGFNPAPPLLEGTGTCEYTIDSQGEGNLANGIFWWRVAARDGSNYGVWSEKRSFTVNTGLTDWDWFQTTEDQWNTNTLSDVIVVSDAVELASGAEEDVFGPESFEGAFLPTGWSKWAWPNNVSPNDWEQGNFTSPSNTPYGSNAAIIVYDTPNYTNRSIQTPQISLTGYSDCYLQFALFRNLNWPDTMRVEVSIDGGGIGGTWNEEAQYNPTNTPASVWDIKTVDLSAYDNNSNVRIAFRYTQLDGNSGGVDYVRIRGTPGASSGIVTSTAIDYDDNPGVTSDWGTLSWGENLTFGDITVDIQYWSGSWVNTPLTGITDNTDFDISSLDPITHNQIRLVGNLTESGGSPILEDWTITWNYGAPNNPPVVTNVSGASGWQTGDISFTYDLADADAEICTMKCEWFDGSWHSTTNLSGTGIDAPTMPGTGKTLTWHSASDYSDESSLIEFRITPNDYTEDGTPGEDNNCDVDNKAPVVSASGVSGTWDCLTTDDITLNGTDGGSGFAGLCPRYSWTAAPTSCIQGIGYTNGSHPSSIPSDENTLYIYGEDAVGNSASTSYTSRQDCDPPTQPGTPTTSSPTCDDTPIWTWTASTDALSGMRASNTYHVYWSTTPGGEDFNAWVDSPIYTHSVPLASPDTWYCKVIGYDEVGNPSTASDNGSVDILEVPTAISFDTPGKSTTSLTWNWFASSGATSYDVNYDAGGWSNIGNVLTYPKTSLGVNTQHCLNVRGQNASCTGTESGDNCMYTLAIVPDAPNCSVAGEFSIFVDVEPNGNPATVEFAIYCVETGQWVQTGGALGASENWQTDAAWDVTTVTGLNCASTYNFRVKARNGDNVETVYGSDCTSTTAACGNQAPNAPTLYNTGGSDQIVFNNARLTDQNAAGGIQLHFRIDAVDPDAPADDVQYYIQVNSASDWSGTNIYDADLSGIHTSGTTVNKLFTCTIAPTDATTYYVRLKAKDPYGSGGYGAWSTDIWSFTYKNTGNPEWHQTEDEQFDTATLTDTETDGSGNVQLSGGVPTDLLVNTTCGDGNYPNGENYEWYSIWAPSGSGTVTVTKLWFWDGDGSVSGSESIYMAMYNDGGGYAKIAGSDATLTGTGTIGWISADVATPFDITLGNSYWVGATSASGGSYRIYRDSNANCAGYPPNGTGSYYQSNNNVLDANVPTGANQSSNKYIIPGITYGTGTTSGTIASPAIDYDSYYGATDWNELLFTDDETNGTISYDVEYWNGGSWVNTPIIGQGSSPVDISSLDPAIHDSIRIEATLTRGTDTPYLNDWTITWEVGVIGVELFEDDQTTPYGTWALGNLDPSDVRIMNATDRVYVKNTGSQAIDISIQCSPVPPWVYSDVIGTTDEFVLMALFNNTIVPVEGDFSTIYDTLGTNDRSAGTGATGKFAGISDGVDIDVGIGEELYFYFKAPDPNTEPNEQDINVTITAVAH